MNYYGPWRINDITSIAMNHPFSYEEAYRCEIRPGKRFAPQLSSWILGITEGETEVEPQEKPANKCLLLTYTKLYNRLASKQPLRG